MGGGLLRSGGWGGNCGGGVGVAFLGPGEGMKVAGGGLSIPVMLGSWSLVGVVGARRAQWLAVFVDVCWRGANAGYLFCGVVCGLCLLHLLWPVFHGWRC